MRKTVLSLILVFVLLVATLSGCSCESATELVFNNDFYSTDRIEPSAGYQETSEYVVKYATEYEGNYAKNLTTDENAFSFEYTDGLYVTTLKTVVGFPEGIDSDIKAEVENKGVNTYQLTSTFTITVNYSIAGGEKKQAVDVIENTVYFCSKTLCYAPIYSYVKSTNTLFTTNNEGVIATKVDVESSTLYNKETFTMKKTAYENGELVNEETTENEYSFKTLIDNNQLYFALRNITIEGESASYTLPTLQSNYSDAKTLRVYNVNTSNRANEFTYNGNPFNGEVAVRNFKFQIAETKTSGIPQFVSIQNVGTDALPYSAIICSFSAPLIMYGTISYMGALVYQLSSYSVTTA